MNKSLLLLITIIILCGAAFLFLTNPKNATEPPSPTPHASTQNTPTPNNPEIDLGASGSSYLDHKGVYSILYPNDYQIDTQDPIHIRIYKRGQTQRPQSEMSDGALMVFESIDLSGKSLEEWVDTRIKESTSDGTSQIINPKKEINQNSYPGFYFSIHGLGDSQNLVIQKDKKSNNAVIITYLVSDPQNKGYQKEVDLVLKSIKLLK